ncbi:MAG: chemotaxis protein CheW [Candidatus Bathyarchaeota archaeon]|nr:chemotaxis protein CheW [Candidatus Bathyarchaeota archaeon]
MSRTVARTKQEVAAIVEEPAIEERDTTQFVVFTLGNEEYGVGILDVREIVKTGTITMIPNSPDFLKGVINLRSKIVGVIDLEKRFLLKREDEEHTGKHIVIAMIDDGTFGLLVDEVTDVLRLPKGDIKLPPEMITKKIGIDYVKGIGTLGEKLIILLDLEKVLSEKELIELARTSAREYRRVKPRKKEKAPEEKLAEETEKSMEIEILTPKQEMPEEKLPKEKETTEWQALKETLPKEEQLKPEKKVAETTERKPL